MNTAGEMMHISINHSGALQRGVRYFSEVSTTPSFNQPLVIDHGTSRTSHPITLPTNDASGNTQSYYVRSYAQDPGGPPSSPYTVGGVITYSAHDEWKHINDALIFTRERYCSESWTERGTGIGKIPIEDLMSVRDLRPTDYEEIKKLHAKMGMDYEMPDLNSPLFGAEGFYRRKWSNCRGQRCEGRSRVLSVD